MTRLRVVVDVEVDDEAWAKEYDCTPAEASEDAATYLPSLVEGLFAAHKEWGVLTAITVTGDVT